MKKLKLVIGISDDVDPARTDPASLAEDILGEYEDWANRNGGIRLDTDEALIEAEWVD